MSYDEKLLFQRELAILGRLYCDSPISECQKTMVNNQIDLYKRALEEISKTT
ncbi:hypothetical protein J0K78_03795 [Halobacillus sp. GSS1]|uniref:hypothetical protein n=1 Tax=Halobacillus sp. GSS1 TaxID=2815919 RepID=UPI001A8F5C80|nr:hypothetical protein [Halobacillus sp. GSS1]MBN9653379.1 hypothetical protein [Halobacillus sp. GSS1]